jgi:hypothetical protein
MLFSFSTEIVPHYSSLFNKVTLQRMTMNFDLAAYALKYPKAPLLKFEGGFAGDVDCELLFATCESDEK